MSNQVMLGLSPILLFPSAPHPLFPDASTFPVAFNSLPNPVHAHHAPPPLMHTGNLQAAAGRLQDALEQLQLAWNQTGEHWRDDNSRHIQAELLDPLAHEVLAAIPAIGQMSTSLQQAFRECQE